jgi:hypothetical protein
LCYGLINPDGKGVALTLFYFDNLHTLLISWLLSINSDP